MSGRKVRVYDKEFKLNAVKLYVSSKRTYAQVSQELGIPVGTLIIWVKNHNENGHDAFPEKGHIKPSDVALVSLRKELAIVREERDILKKH